MDKKYAGIGSRETPRPVLDLMIECATKLQNMSYILRSGRAIGADTAFEFGAGKLTDLFVADDATPESIDFVSSFHPAWNKCNDYARKLHGRNAMIILGKELNDPVKFVICYTSDGKPTGGTATGIRIANAYNIPVFNLYDNKAKTRILDFVGINMFNMDVL